MTKGITRREFIKSSVAGSLTIGAALSTTSCSVSGQPLATKSNTKQIKRGGTLIFATEAEETGLDPRFADYDTTGVLYERTFYDPLAILDANGIPQPYLAESITPSPDYDSWQIKVRPNVYFHDGSLLDAKVVQANFEHYQSALSAVPLTMTLIKSVDIVDDLTVKVNLSSPWVPFDYWLAGGIGAQFPYMLAPAMLKASSNYSSTHPIGTGPFIFQEWVPNSHLRAKANPNYWRKGLPYLDAIEYRPIPNENSRLQSLLAGNVDMIHTSSSTTIKALQASGLSFITDAGKIVGEPDMNFILLNHNSAKPFYNIYACQAIAYATNRDRYAKIIGNGIELPSDGPFVPNTPYYNGPTGYPNYDLTKAKQAVENYKATTGMDLTFTLGTTPDPQSSIVAQFLQNEWQQAGMKVNINASIQQDALISNAISGNFDAYIWRQFAALHPDINYIFWSSSTIYKGFYINMAQNRDPIIDNALNAARAEADPVKQAKYYQTVAKRFAVDIPYAWLTRTIWAVAAASQVQNYDNPTTPNGLPAYGMISGIIWPTEIWLNNANRSVASF
jgi:peptide/nickel transport system substrate-binding protein